jgi:hypothetical protein
MRGIARVAAAAALLFALLVSAPDASGGTEGPERVVLRTGQERFWRGTAPEATPANEIWDGVTCDFDSSCGGLPRPRRPVATRSGGRDLCAEGVVACADHTVVVAEEGWRLRVAAQADYGLFNLELYDPSGMVRAYGVSTDKGSTAGRAEVAELFVRQPAVGPWMVRLLPRSTPSDRSYRMRAALEAEPEAGVLVEPNLRAEPPFAPALDACDAVGGSADVGAGAVGSRCLRFGVGWQNAGDGPLEIRFDTVASPVGSPHPCPPNADVDGATTVHAVQYRFVRQPGDRPYDDRHAVVTCAGTGSFHPHAVAARASGTDPVFAPNHGHYHYDGTARIELLPVLDATVGVLGAPVLSRKDSACPGDRVFVNFTRFNQDPRGTSGSPFDCNAPVAGPMGTGLSAGWGGVYLAKTGGNEVPFDGLGDGEYVLRAVIDPSQQVVESNERDNTGYAHLRVSDGAVTLLERGHGRHPWDLDKRVVPNDILGR